ncbi:MAG: tRNA uridine-5-carboxymethylaminomethyl(34) synthesis enzyme MnmG, partial [Deltaproteobacteria bacterium]|nr:tRNA uridine-5-carboxymethylaminomethyl(34) synthesis enzyme MnmG [Deltaproteobacteria bacterium]
MDYDVIVIGAGHAGCEAAAAAARLGLVVQMITLRKDRVAWMSCNPAIGGIGKGHLVKEIDALGGLMGAAADRCGIQRRTLNTQKGYAVRATRAQCDMYMYSAVVAGMISRYKNIEVLEDEVLDLIIDGGRIQGVRTAKNGAIGSKAVVLSAGTFLDAVMHSGEEITPGGRTGERPASRLSASLKNSGLDLRRFKTGTPPRIAASTIDFSVLEPQFSDPGALPFSITTSGFAGMTSPCHITYTNDRTHEIILANIHRAPIFNGQIHSRGPRYCPSIEDKVHRFREKPRHQIFLEPVSGD